MVGAMGIPAQQIEDLSREDFLKQLMPVIRSRDLAHTDGPFKRVGEGLGAFLTIDLPDKSVYVTAKMLSKHEITKDEATKTALDNLIKRTDPKFRKLAQANVIIGDWNDGYDSSRILLPRIFTSFSFIKKPRVAVPTRGLILFWDADDIAAKTAAKEIIEESFLNGLGPISKEIIAPVI